MRSKKIASNFQESGGVVSKYMEILSKLKENPRNPRTITSAEFEKLKESIKQFPQMLEQRPIVYDENYYVLGGNMRLKAVQRLAKEGFEIKDSYFSSAEGWTEEQKTEFLLKDNRFNGAWNFDELANFDEELLKSVGFSEKELQKAFGIDEEKPEVEFTEELNEAHNYVVLYFDNDIDWLQLQTLYPLPTVKALDAKKGYERKGVGRVVNGANFLKEVRK